MTRINQDTMAPFLPITLVLCKAKLSIDESTLETIHTITHYIEFFTPLTDNIG